LPAGWAFHFGGDDLDRGRYVAVDAANNVYQTAIIYSESVDLDPGAGIATPAYNAASNPAGEHYVAKYSAAGQFLWARAFGAVTLTARREHTETMVAKLNQDGIVLGARRAGESWGTGITAPRVAGPPQINDGTGQRSMVYSLTVTFDSVVTFATIPGAAFTLTRIGGAAVGSFQANATTVNNGTQTQVVLSGFRGAEAHAGSLAEGRYTLGVMASQITSQGLPLDGNADGTGGDDYVFTDNGKAGGLYRLYGDANGDRVVDAADLSLFRGMFGATTSDPTFDWDADGVVNAADLNRFRSNFGVSF
jgi:hypothetical protein